MMRMLCRLGILRWSVKSLHLRNLQWWNSDLYVLNFNGLRTLLTTLLFLIACATLQLMMCLLSMSIAKCGKDSFRRNCKEIFVISSYWQSWWLFDKAFGWSHAITAINDWWQVVVISAGAILQTASSRMSLMYSKKNLGPRMDPWGT